MNIKQGEYLEAVCRLGSITAAATELFVSRTAISHALNELEDEFNAALFVRTRTGLALTEAGEVVRKLCQQNREAYNISKNKIEAMNGSRARHYIRLALTPTTGERFFPDFFKSFYQKYPDITCEIGEIPAGDTIRCVREGEIECAITPIDFPPFGCEDIGILFLYQMQSVFCISKNDPLSEEPFLTLDHVKSRKIVSLPSPTPINMPIEPTIRVSNVKLIHSIIANEMAISILPIDFVKDWGNVAAVPFVDPLTDDVNFIWNKELPHSDSFNKLLSFVQDYDRSKLVLAKEPMDP